MYSTTSIEVYQGEDIINIGTGFFFSYDIPPCNFKLPLIITNKHVIKNSTSIKFRFTKIDELSGFPIDNKYLDFKINTLNLNIYYHSTLDICAIDINLLNFPNIFFMSLDKSFLANTNIMENLSAVEDILMVGYPSGIWDEVNNKPVFRKGITATHPKFDYNGKKEFLIDAACFPGSSGSPVFIYNENGYLDKNKNAYCMETRVLFMGIMRGGHQHVIQSEDAYESYITKIPNNLGVVIKANAILDLEYKIIESFFKQNRLYSSRLKGNYHANKF